MIKHDDELHISMRDPMRLKLEGRSIEIVAIDATLLNDNSEGLIGLTCDAVYRRHTHTVESRAGAEAKTISYDVCDPVKFRGKIWVHPSNIAGVVSQPFRKQ